MDGVTSLVVLDRYKRLSSPPIV